MRLMPLFPLITLALAAAPDGILGEPAYRKEVQGFFEAQRKLARNRPALFGVFGQKLTTEEREALTFLITGMPLSDLADQDGAFYLAQVRASLQARRLAPWGPGLPADLFRHFVLPVRVNNEHLDAFRTTHFRELLARVKGLSMTQAALEINHWCHERVVYQGSDARTSGPLATLRTGHGRCGEESTFTVAALRAACIPARQVYTPRWAHCDDNHAWVEVWVDGAWHFLGACEPEPALDMGWFKEPARRAMLVHTRAFGPYRGTEPVLRATERYAELNLTAHYAPVRRLEVEVLDREGRPVVDATVAFTLYNYAEFYPLVTRQTGPDGKTALETGLGDLLVWAHKGEAFGFQKVSVDRQDRLTLRLDVDPTRTQVVDLDQVPPVERPAQPVGAEAKAENDRRLAAEDGLRKAYTDTFPTADRAQTLLAAQGIREPEAAEFLVKAAGNWRAILAFLSGTPAPQRAWALRLLGEVSPKDLRDTPAGVLKDHLEGALAAAPDLARKAPDTFAEAVLSPRIDVELLSAFRAGFRRVVPPALAASFRKDPLALVAWVKREIRIDDAANHMRTPIQPLGVWDLRVADGRSRDIFFVALARSLGQPARLHPSLRTPQLLVRDAWVDAAFDPATPAGPRAALRLKPEGDLKYANHATLARFEGGRYRTLAFEDGAPLAGLPSPLDVPAGPCLAVTGNRQPDGTVLARLSFFTTRPGETTEVPLSLRQQTAPLPVLGQLNLAAPLQTPQGPRSLGDLAGGRAVVLAWVAPGQEPTRHLMGDLRDLAGELEKTGCPLLLATPGTALGQDFLNLPATSRLVQDPTQALLQALGASLGRPVGGRPPVLVVLDPAGRVVYFSEGYQIGVGEQALKTLKRLK